MCKYHIVLLKWRKFRNLNKTGNLFLATEDCNIVTGGDFNVILDPYLDRNGGNPKRKDKITDALLMIRSPTVKQFTWRQKKSVIQGRLDFWLVIK